MSFKWILKLGIDQANLIVMDLFLENRHKYFGSDLTGSFYLTETEQMWNRVWLGYCTNKARLINFQHKVYLSLRNPQEPLNHVK